MPIRTTSLVLIASLLWGCTSVPVDVGTVPTPPSEVPPTGTEISCADVRLTSPTDVVGPRDLVQLVPAGGSGAFVFDVQPAFAGTVEPTTWAFFSGTEATTATITVTDSNCPGSAEVAIEVFSELVGSPERARVAPGDTLTPTFEGGSGTNTCSIVASDSGATLSGCTYTAGSSPGEDQVRITDDVLGTFHDVRIEVVEGASFVVAGHEGVVIPFGSAGSGTWFPEASAGSDVLEVTVLNGPFSSTGPGLVATSLGDGRVRVEDLHTGAASEVDVRAIGPLVPVLVRDGERTSQGNAIPLGDVNGDGHSDVALGFIEPGLDAHYGGIVAVYDGTPSGLQSTPSMVFAGDAVNQTLGRSLLAADVNGDGHTDLLMGADRADIGDTNNGLVRIHHGTGSGFEAVPRRLVGEIPFSRFGSALAACDLDGDGFVDLAVGAMEAADLATAVPAEDQGAIQIFYGGASGYTDSPDFEVFGAFPTAGGGFEPGPFQELGTSLVAGDFDGDGLCDLAAGTPESNVDGFGEDGAVFIFRGRDDGSVLSRTPDRWIVGAVGEDAEFGRRLAAGDVDGDGIDELLVSAWKVAGSDGAVHLFRNVLNGTEALSVSDANWTAMAEDPSDQFGSDVRLDDMNGDGLPDVVVGAYKAQDGASDQGRAFAFLQPSLSGQTVLATDASLSVTGEQGRDRFGQAVAGYDDVDGDGLGEIFGLAGFSSLYGVEAGVPYLMSSTGSQDALALPGVASGHGVGASVARLDVDADGDEDLVFGAPDAGVFGVGGNAGQTFVSYNEGGVFLDPVPFLIPPPSHSGSDRFGRSMQVLDFDGDGFDDLAVAARTDSRPSTFSSESYSGDGTCGPFRSFAGSVHIYRGSELGLQEEASYAWFGPEVSGTIQSLAAADTDGDGRDELLVSSQEWDIGGGFQVLPGRPHIGPGILVMCDESPVVGNDRFDRLGASLSGLGDLDGDDCEEFAVGATGEEFRSDWNNQGSVRVFWGSGPSCAAEPMVSTLQFEVIGTGLGAGVVGGEDVDGDGIGDLLVGGAEYRVYFAEHGAVWFVPGSWVTSVPRQSWLDGLPEDADTIRSELLPFTGLDATFGLVGDDAAGEFGTGLGLVDVAGETFVGVTAPFGGQGGVRRTGGMELYRVGTEGLERPAAKLVVGEGPLDGGLGTVVRTRGGLTVTAPTSSSEGLAVGAVYPVSFP